MNLANKITLIRVLLIPIFVIILFCNLSSSHYIATFIFIIASITDGLDGYIARSRNQITTLGKFIDPLADKLLISTALISLVELGKIPAWIVIIIIGREFTITGFRTIAASANITVAASPLGKLKTITQIIAIISLLLDNYPFNLISFPFDVIMLYISLGFTIISGIDYIYMNRAVLQTDDRRG
ncbi:MAG TPA: CDP-diacylglycerol--glycerol-3-phosphate 3-phosphatidyltransferase [Tepidimicrobium sp.]|nr:CDP-diacylglycerol--glycerol-3-phosphate 3-phosphatidyltransferase [Tepidimicrobium sp.]